MGRRWARFWHFLWHGIDETPARWPCPKCGALVPMGPAPTFSMKEGVLVFPWTNAEIREKCPNCGSGGRRTPEAG